MEKEKTYFTFMDLIMDLANDPEVAEDPAVRAQTAFGLVGALALVVL